MENIIEKIKKLLAKAKDSSVTEEEAIAYMNKAQELLSKHNLDMSSLQEEEESPIDRTVIETPYGHIKWRRELLTVVAQLFFCKGFILETNGKDRLGKNKIVRKFIFAGREHNRVIAISMFEYLCATVVRLSREYSSDPKARYHFEQGCGRRLTVRVFEKIMLANSPVANNGEKSNLPALYSTELALIDDFMAGKKVTTIDGHKVKFNVDSVAGYRAANGISLDNQLTGKSPASKFLLK